MEEKSRFAQILIFWDAVLLGTLIFISLSVKPGLRCLWLHSAMLAECAIGLLILGILTFGKSEPDIVHGRLFTVMIGGISLQLVLYYDQPLILHTFLLILMLTITIYRNFSLCKFAMVEMMVLYLLSVLYYWRQCQCDVLGSSSRRCTRRKFYLILHLRNRGKEPEDHPGKPTDLDRYAAPCRDEKRRSRASCRGKECLFSQYVP